MFGDLLRCPGWVPPGPLLSCFGFCCLCFGSVVLSPGFGGSGCLRCLLHRGGVPTHGLLTCTSRILLVSDSGETEMLKVSESCSGEVVVKRPCKNTLVGWELLVAFTERAAVQWE